MNRLRTVGVVVFALLAVVPPAQADELPDWVIRSAVAGAFVAQMADSATTYRGLSHPCDCYTELNPLLPDHSVANLGVKGALASYYLMLGWAATSEVRGWERWALLSSVVAISVIGTRSAVQNSMHLP